MAGNDHALATLLGQNGHELIFNLLDVGALPLEGQSEPFHPLLDAFPSSRLSALEIDPVLCEALNRKARPGTRYYPCALGRTEEKRTLYHTAHSMCTSLYEPDERYPDLFHLLDVTRLREISSVDTISLDTFARRHGVGALDFIKMDVQGAELDVLQGGATVLEDVLLLVSEVEFTPMYKDQPLFADIDAYLRAQGFMFHKFLGMSGRVMKPLSHHGTGRYPVQMMWSDAVYTRDLFSVDALDEQQMLKLAVLLDVYGSKDVALHVLKHYDKRAGTDLGPPYMNLITASGEWALKQPEQQ